MDANLQNSLSSKLEAAQAGLDDARLTSAVNQLEAFINAVEAQRGKKISEEAAEALIAAAQLIIAQIGLMVTPTDTIIPTDTVTPTETMTPTGDLTPGPSTLTGTRPTGEGSLTPTQTPTDTSTPTSTETITPSPTTIASPLGTATETPASLDTPASLNAVLSLPKGFNGPAVFSVGYFRPQLALLAPKTPTFTVTATPTVTDTLTMTPTATDTPTSTTTSTSTATHTAIPIPPEPVTIDYAYDPLYRLTEANYSTGDYYHYTYDSVGNRLTQDSSVDGLPSSVAYQYDEANRLTSVDGVAYTFDANGNLLNDGTNTYTYDSANRLTSVLGPSSSSQYIYSGLGDRLSQTVDGVTMNYTLDLNAGLTQVLDDGTSTYLYGNGRISQRGTSTEYFLGDALGSVRQLTNEEAEITLTKAYEPYGEEAWSYGEGQSAFAYTGEATDANGLVYLRARFYNPLDGRFISRDTWEGDVNSPMSLNRWNYVEGNPVNLNDPSGHFPQIVLQTISQALPQYVGSSNNFNILSAINDCTSTSRAEKDHPQVDLTGYLALAMTKHGQDTRVKEIADLVTWGLPASLIVAGAGSIMLAAAYIKFFNLEGPEKEWDIKRNMENLANGGIVLCGKKTNCRWVDYSTAGNIHFGYIARLSKIDQLFAGIAGGVLEQIDSVVKNRELKLLNCISNNVKIVHCDDPGDQAAVDFGFELAKDYPAGITDEKLRVELDAHGFGSFQKPLTGFKEPFVALPEINQYGADHFNN